MRNAFLALLITSPLFLSGQAFSQIKLVHATSCGALALPGSCSIPATGQGNLLVVGLQSYVSTSVTINSVTDSTGNVYLEAVGSRASDTGSHSTIDIWYASGVAAGTTSVTITPNSTAGWNDVVVWEFSGIANAAPLDAVSSLSNQPSTTAPSSPAITTAAASEVVIALMEVSGSLSGIASGNAFTSDAMQDGNGWAHLITSQAGSYSAKWSMPGGGTYTSTIASFRGAVTTGGACDINQDGFVNILDTQIAADMYLGMMPCTLGNGACTATVANEIASASLGGNCTVTAGSGTIGGNQSTPHSVSLSWTASPTQNVTYNVYRGTASGGPYSTKVASALGTTSYTDSTVQAGKTYYYVATAVNSAGESGYSNQAQAIIPTP